MNERIEKLMNTLPTDSSGKLMSVGDAEKLAKMIVKECMKVANTYQNRGGNCYVDNMIAEHFGVEDVEPTN